MIKWLVLVIVVVAIWLVGAGEIPIKSHKILSPWINRVVTAIPLPTVTVRPTQRAAEPTLITKPTVRSVKIGSSKVVGDTTPWGVSRQIDEHTWTMRIQMDKKMATAEEILIALNNYRAVYNSQKLTRDNKLADYAQERVNYLVSIKNVDGHRGFLDFLENQNGYDKLGFNWLGENISYGYRMEGVHLIEWLYAGDKPHNENQLNNRWNYVGIGVKETATCLIFATGKR